MRFVNMVTLAVFGFASAAMAIPGGKDNDEDHKKKHKEDDNDEECKCLKKKDVKELTEAYQRLVGDFNIADAPYLAEDFSDWSQSINTFVRPSPPFEGVTFPTKQSFIDSQSKQTNKTPILIEGEPVIDCKRFSFIWSSTFGKGRPARGITIIEATKKTGKWQISRIDVEFNSLTWAWDLNGYYCFFGRNDGNVGSCAPPPSVSATSSNSTNARRSGPFIA